MCQEAITCFAADGHLLFSGAADCTVRIWETLQTRPLQVVRLHEATVQALLVLPGAVVSCAGGRVAFWRYEEQEGKELEVIQSYEQPEEFRTLHARL